MKFGYLRDYVRSWLSCPLHLAIRLSLKWYNDHLASSISSKKGKGRASAPFVVMMSDDADNRRKAAADGLKAFSVRAYVEGLKDSSAALLDLLAATGAPGEDDLAIKKGLKKALYPDVRM